MATHNNTSEKPIFAYSGWTHLGLAVFLWLFLFIKNAPLFLAGQFVSEDSFYFYETAYNADWITAVTTPYAGYLHVLPMLLAELLWNVPFAVLPWVNHGVALTLCVLLMSWFYMPYCRNLIPSDGARASCVVILALTPYQPNLGMLLGLHWYLSFAIGLILLSDLPRKPGVLAALCGFVVLSAWSAPATTVLVPLAIVRWWLWRKDNRRYVPLSFAAASIAYALAIQFVFKPNSSQPGFADISTVIEASWIMLTQGLLLDSIWGLGFSSRLPNIAEPLLPVAVVATLAFFIWRGRDNRHTWLGLLLIGIGGLVLGLAMLRGFQSALIVKMGTPLAERYLTTPSFYFWAGFFVIMAPQVPKLKLRGRTIGLLALAIMSVLLSWKAPDLSGKTPLAEAFPHARKAQLLAEYEARVANGGQAETLALPGWTPIECMRLKVGGGRQCVEEVSIECIFGTDLKLLNEDRYQIDWLGTLEPVAGAWYRHDTLGVIAPIGYEKGFYWFQDDKGQRYLSGPAIYPSMFEYPLKNMIWVEATKR